MEATSISMPPARTAGVEGDNDDDVASNLDEIFSDDDDTAGDDDDNDSGEDGGKDSGSEGDSDTHVGRRKRRKPLSRFVLRLIKGPPKPLPPGNETSKRSGSGNSAVAVGGLAHSDDSSVHSTAGIAGASAKALRRYQPTPDSVPSSISININSASSFAAVAPSSLTSSSSASSS